MIADRGAARLFTRGALGCATCHWVLRWLDRHGVRVHESDITVDPAARDQLRHLTNADLPVPTLLLPDGQVVVGPGPATLEALFGVTGRRR